MLNKKLLAIASIIATLSASASYAKTEGGYVGVDISRYSVTDKYPSPEDTQVSPAFGINAKYAINFDKVFIPDPSLEKNLPIKIPIKKAQKLNCNKLVA